MALIVSAASGNFNAGATWVGGVVPTVGDEARASTGHTVTINVNTTCNRIENTPSSTGTFVLSDGVTLTANVLNQGTASTVVLTFSASSGAIVGDVSGGGSTSRVAVRNSGSGTLSITGNVTGNANGAWGVENTGVGTTIITGNCTAVRNSTTGSIYITGNASASGSVSGAENQSTGTLSIIGTVIASQTAAGVAGANVQQVTILSGPFITETTRGVNPVYCAAWRWNASPSNSTYMEVMTNNLLTKRSLYTADNITGMPAASNVKSGIAYGPSSELTGTFAQTVTPSTADIATAVWSAATRTITGGTVTTLTNAPTVPTAAAIATQVRTELSSELSKISALNTTRLGQCTTTEILGNLLAQANS
jgi:hypothetical protein